MRINILSILIHPAFLKYGLILSLTSGMGTNIPPSAEQVVIYFGQQNRSVKKALDFYNYYKYLGWRDPRGQRIRNWKQLAWRWIWYERKMKRSENRADN